MGLRDECGVNEKGELGRKFSPFSWAAKIAKAAQTRAFVIMLKLDFDSRFVLVNLSSIPP
jgi:hypothetical protein